MKELKELAQKLKEEYGIEKDFEKELLNNLKDFSASIKVEEDREKEYKAIRSKLEKILEEHESYKVRRIMLELTWYDDDKLVWSK